MEATETTDERSISSPQESFVQEFQRIWLAWPDKLLFGALLLGWFLLFKYFGWATLIAGQTPSLFEWMYSKWDSTLFDSQHGKYVPYVVLALLWHRRKILAKSHSGVWWPGLALLAFALLLHIVGFLVQQPRLSVIAFFFGIYALFGLVWGRKMLVASFFPLFLFAFCVPLGGTFAQGVTLPLRVVMAKMSAFVAGNVLDVSVIRQGTRLMDAHQHWNYDVAPECSGIRSFTALLAITMTLAVMKFRTWWKRAVIILMTVPLVVFCNVLRLSTIVVMSAAYSFDAGRLTDAYFGYVTYALGIGIVLLVAQWLRERTMVATS